MYRGAGQNISVFAVHYFVREHVKNIRQFCSCSFVCLLCRRRPAGVREREVFVCVFVYDAPKRTNSSAACSFASVTISHEHVREHVREQFHEQCVCVHIPKFQCEKLWGAYEV